MYVVALFTTGWVPARYRGVWLVKDIGENTFGHCVLGTASIVARPPRNDGAKALSFSFVSH